MVTERDLFGDPYIRRDAEFAGEHRISIDRWWDGVGPTAFVLGCNPSDADARRDDPTSRWWNAWFRLYGFRGYRAGNLYPFCTSSPAECRKIADWHNNGPDWHARDAIQHNLSRVVEMAKAADKVFVCFGGIAWDDDWINHVVEEIQTGEEPWPDLWCWGETASGAPKHPMARGLHRIPRDQPALLWSPSIAPRAMGIAV